MPKYLHMYLTCPDPDGNKILEAGLSLWRLTQLGTVPEPTARNSYSFGFAKECNFMHLVKQRLPDAGIFDELPSPLPDRETLNWCHVAVMEESKVNATTRRCGADELCLEKYRLISSNLKQQCTLQP
ncbi:hypothetical protein OIU85_028034 [Salix viminalis]|uniref:Uncharacterized protein n=1 Tax=Salix viminalis TaxID=40686 RepID=A0A9Q0QJJ6_SALVM|nr:hypothetical protein OIU85_028034 [Salix viminalis]